MFDPICFFPAQVFDTLQCAVFLLKSRSSADRPGASCNVPRDSPRLRAEKKPALSSPGVREIKPATSSRVTLPDMERQSIEGPLQALPDFQSRTAGVPSLENLHRQSSNMASVHLNGHVPSGHGFSSFDARRRLVLGNFKMKSSITAIQSDIAWLMTESYSKPSLGDVGNGSRSHKRGGTQWTNLHWAGSMLEEVLEDKTRC